MKMNDDNGFVAWLLFAVFLVLKLTGVISWSWWWVTAPFWGGFAIVGGVVLLALIAAIVVSR